MTALTRMEISISQQILNLYLGEDVVASYFISTAIKGAGELSGSEKTPRGRHTVRAKIGEGLPENAVFVGRRFTGEIYDSELACASPDRDWILARILWLCGCEPGKNRLGDVDSMRRFIYIHGTPDTELMGIAKSHGCIRMRNSELIELFDRVEPGCRVDILE
jgi:lipoprotein-anchoring transpeptidase ErfK/SrfK